MTEHRMPTAENDAATMLVSHLLEHYPDGAHREAYCVCGAPLGEYDSELPNHLADVLRPLLTTRVISPEKGDDA